MTKPHPRLYRLLKATAQRAPKAHRGVVLMIAIFSVITAVCIVIVGKRHDVLRAGYELSKTSHKVSQLREANRQLTIELAMLSAPDRIRTLATQLGMIPVPPDQIRVVVSDHKNGRANQPVPVASATTQHAIEGTP
jgi:cell division protein FtsL